MVGCMGEFSTFKADHTGGEPVVKSHGSGHLTIDNPLPNPFKTTAGPSSLTFDPYVRNKYPDQCRSKCFLGE